MNVNSTTGNVPSSPGGALTQPAIPSGFEQNCVALFAILEEAYELADLKAQGKVSYLPWGDSGAAEVLAHSAKLAEVRHGARGVALTLSAYKSAVSSQDIRQHKAELPGGFSARSFDSRVVVPFLKERSLPYNVESHWLSQSFSFAGSYTRQLRLATQPKVAGPLLLEVVNGIEEHSQSGLVAKAVVLSLMTGLVNERNKGVVQLTRPKDLVIDLVLELLEGHFSVPYQKNAPRLPQVAIYALYKCICTTMERYEGLELQPLERMKAANRKSGSVGDIDVNRGDKPYEAVEVKFGKPVAQGDVAEAIQKIKHATVERYLILSTAGVVEADVDIIQRLKDDFKRTNGCEIIVNGVLDTIRYYLRLVRSTSDFIFEYTKLVEVDEDLDYAHRLAWNAVCERVLK